MSTISIDLLDDESLPGPGQLAEIRNRLGLSPAEAADKLGFTKHQLYYYSGMDVRVMKLHKVIEQIEALGGRVTMTVAFDIEEETSQ